MFNFSLVIIVAKRPLTNIPVKSQTLQFRRNLSKNSLCRNIWPESMKEAGSCYRNTSEMSSTCWCFSFFIFYNTTKMIQLHQHYLKWNKSAVRFIRAALNWRVPPNSSRNKPTPPCESFNLWEEEDWRKWTTTQQDATQNKQKAHGEFGCYGRRRPICNWYRQKRARHTSSGLPALDPGSRSSSVQNVCF